MEILNGSTQHIPWKKEFIEIDLFACWSFVSSKNRQKNSIRQRSTFFSNLEYQTIIIIIIANLHNIKLFEPLNNRCPYNANIWLKINMATYQEQ